MRKVLVYWIQITDHGRCDEPRDHIWHTLDRYHSLDRGPGSDENGIKTLLSNLGDISNVFLQVVVTIVNALQKISALSSFTCSTTHFPPSTLFSIAAFLAGWLWPSDLRLSSDVSKGPQGGIFWLLFAPIGSPSNERMHVKIFHLETNPPPFLLPMNCR